MDAIQNASSTKHRTKHNASTRRALVYALAACAISASTVHADGSDLHLQNALERDVQGVPVTYDVHYESLTMAAIFTVDPTKPSGQRVSVMTPPKELWGTEFALLLSEIDEDAADQLFCRSLFEDMPSTVKRIGETDSVVTYAFSPAIADEDDDDDDDDAAIMPYLEGRVSIDKTDSAILRYRLFAPTSFKPTWLVDIRRFELTADCERLADGRTYISRLSMQIEGRAGSEDFRESESWQLTSVMPKS